MSAPEVEKFWHTQYANNICLKVAFLQTKTMEIKVYELLGMGEDQMIWKNKEELVENPTKSQREIEFFQVRKFQISFNFLNSIFSIKNQHISDFFCID